MTDQLDLRLGEYTPAVERAVRELLTSAPEHAGLYEMIRYHLGWSEAPDTEPQDGGKRLRSALCLLVAETAGGDWRSALPAAAAVELVHNFSLIHDDIEDVSQFRRHRETVWAKWGEAQALNAGDALLIISHQALFETDPRLSADVAVAAYRILSAACRALCEGQYLDLLWEGGPTVALDAYLGMVERKTARLFACAAELGALCGGAAMVHQEGFSQFARALGMAFQVADDILGVWSPQSETGKPEALDIVTRKKALPATLALGSPDSPRVRRFQEIFDLPRSLDPAEAGEAIQLLDELGIRAQASAYLAGFRAEALGHLDQVAPGSPGQPLRDLIEEALPAV
ncbi:MAG: polyprenyl synthetase family protein [Chloroflexi bacterium]|nr:polyprenyl synthetase family protein [Chloroflexota bacterium]